MKNGWPMVRFGEVLQLQRRWLKPDPLTDYGEIGVRSFGNGIFHKLPVSGASLGDKRVLRIEPGDLVFMNVFAWEGAVAVAGPDVAGKIGSHRFATYTPVDGKVDVRFLNLYFKTHDGRELLGRVSPGSALRNRTMNLSQFAEQKVPLPPLPEQRRIMARIESLAAKIGDAAEWRQQADNLANVAVSAHAGEVFARLQSKYEPSCFGQLDAVVTSGPRNWSQFISQSGLRFYRAQDIRSDFVVDASGKCFITPPVNGQAADAKLRDGDLLIVITGATVGRCARYSADLEPGYVSQHVAVCRFKSTSIDSRFALWALRSPAGQAQLLGQRYGQGKPGLNLSNLRSLTLPIPPLAEQRQIVAHLNALTAKTTALKQLQSQSAAELEALLPSILDRAFKGEL